MYDLKKMAAEFKKGDKVYVLREADDGEMGWSLDWHPDMDDMVGKSSTVQYIEGDGVVLEDDYNYPPFVLEKVTFNPFKKGDKVRCRGVKKWVDCDFTVMGVDDIYVYGMDHYEHHKNCTLIKPAKPQKKKWKLGCQEFDWKGNIFASKSVGVTRNQLKAIYEQVNSLFCPASWILNKSYILVFKDGYFWCEGHRLGDVDLLKEILEYKEN